jgi:hypothetical protein
MSNQNQPNADEPARSRWRKAEINAAVREGGRNVFRSVPAVVCGLLAVHRSTRRKDW